MTLIRPNSAPTPLAPRGASDESGAARSGAAESASSAYEEFLSIFQDLLSGGEYDNPAREGALPGVDVLALHPVVPTVMTPYSPRVARDSGASESEVDEDIGQELPRSTGGNLLQPEGREFEKTTGSPGDTTEQTPVEDGASRDSGSSVVEDGDHGVTANVAQAASAVDDLATVIKLSGDESASLQSHSIHEQVASPFSSETLGTSTHAAVEIPVETPLLPLTQGDIPDVPRGDLTSNRVKTEATIAITPVELPIDLETILVGVSSDAHRDTHRAQHRGESGFDLPQAVVSTAKVTQTLPDIPAENATTQSALFLRHAFEGGASLASLTHRGGNDSANRQILPGSSLSRQVRGVEATQRSSNAAPRTAPILAMQRIADAAQEGARQGHRSLSVQLDPPALGTVTVTVAMTERGVHTRIIPEQSQTTQLIREHAPELQQMIRRQLGISIQDVTLSVSDGSGTFEQLATTSDGSSSGWSNDKRGDVSSADLEQDDGISPRTLTPDSIERVVDRSTDDSWIA